MVENGMSYQNSKGGGEVKTILFEGENFRVIQDTNIPFFKAYSTKGQRDCFFNCTLADLMENLRIHKPEWLREINMVGD
jgi:hypothetical protein